MSFLQCLTGLKEFESVTFGMPLPLQPTTGLPRRSRRFAATPRHQRPHSPRRARPVGAEGSQLPPATNAPTAPDGLVPPELKVHSYTTPPTPLQPRRACPVGAKGSQLPPATNTPAAPAGLAAYRCSRLGSWPANLGFRWGKPVWEPWSLVKDRPECSGMRWTIKGTQAMSDNVDRTPKCTAQQTPRAGK